MSAAVFIKIGVRTILSVTKHKHAHTQNEWYGFYEVYPKYHANDDAADDDDRNHLVFATAELVGNKKNYRWKSDSNNNDNISLNCHLIGGSITPVLDLSWTTPIPNRLCLGACVCVRVLAFEILSLAFG